MIFLGLWLLVLGVSATEAANFNQQTGGSCSPIVGQTGGNVTLTMNCPGMDPKLLDGLNRELGLARGQLQLTKLQLDQKTNEANEMVRKHQDLSRQLETLQDSKLTSQGKALLNDWKLEKADNLLKGSTISRDQFLTIKDGMSYQDVVRILGRPGVEGASAGSVVNYSWHNPDMSMAVVAFNNGRVMGKSPGNLR
jgi:hypothetical protein